MNLRNNKGYFGIDAAIAMIVLLIIVPTIGGMIYNVTKTNNEMSRKTEAISIAVNSIEAIKGVGIAGLNDEANYEQDIKTAIQKIYTSLNLEDMTVTKDSNTYQINFEVIDYATTEEGNAKDVQSGVVKIAKVTIKYRVGKANKEISLDTAIS